MNRIVFPLALAILALAVLVLVVPMAFNELEIFRARSAIDTALPDTRSVPSNRLVNWPDAFVRREAINEFSGACRRRYVIARDAGNRDDWLDALFQCEAILSAGLARAPHAGYDWIQLARIRALMSSPTDDIINPIRASIQLAPRRMDVALARLTLGLQLEDRLPLDIRDAVIADVVMLVGAWESSIELADKYIEAPSIRMRIADIVLTTPEEDRARFIRALKRQTKEHLREERNRPYDRNMRQFKELGRH